MDEAAVHLRLRHARAACGEDLDALSRRTAVRVRHLRAIEDGRFDDLPPGIYARAAIRAFAEACGLDPGAVLAGCDARLPRVDDPLDALARKFGVARESGTAEIEHTTVAGETPATWRTLAAASLDALLAGALLTLVVACIAVIGRVPIHSLGPSAAPLALVGVVLAGAYFAWFGGLAGTTFGGVVCHAPRPACDRQPLTLRTIGIGAMSAATADVRGFVSLGVGAARGGVTLAARFRSARRTEPVLWPLRLRGRAPVLWSPANRPVAAPPQPLPRPPG